MFKGDLKDPPSLKKNDNLLIMQMYMSWQMHIVDFVSITNPSLLKEGGGVRMNQYITHKLSLPYYSKLKMNNLAYHSQLQC